LNLHLRPIVVINKIDRKDAQIEATEEQIHDLFLDLAHHDDHLDFPVLYGSSKDGYVTTDSTERSGNMIPLFEAIMKYIPAPEEKTDKGLQFLTTSLDSSDYLGLIAIGRMFSGELTVGQQFVCCIDDEVSKPSKITKIYKFEGLNKIEVDKAEFGDVIAVTGFNEPVKINTTLCEVGNPLPCDYVAIDEPTLVMYLSVNNSPFNGREGKLLTSRQIKERLEKELETNVALRVEPTDSPESFKLSGRGQLHLGILVENMRREGFELQLSAPEVIFKTIDGTKHEPMENLILDVQEEHQGVLMENLGTRKAELTNMTPSGDGRVKLEFKIPSRALIGFRNQFLTDTRGTGILNVSFLGYEPYKGDIPTRNKGAIVSMEPGKVTTYALDNLGSRGEFFIAPGQEVYEGMIIGENSREADLDVNPCKTKKLTNMRSSGADDAAQVGKVRAMTLETCMEWIRPDELIEVTPEGIRLRKKVLKAGLRKRA